MAAWTRAFLLEARAKLNLTLSVGAIQPNRLHEISSFAASLTLADDLRFEPHEGAFAVDCLALDVPERENLAFRAAEALRVDAHRVRIHILKRTPVQAGLGGGSADAAAALVGLARIARERGTTEYSEADLLAAAASLGSDVPACLTPGFKWISGTGEVVRHVALAAPPWGIALLKPASGLSTAVAYKLYNDQAAGSRRSVLPNDGLEVPDDIASCIRSRRFSEFCERLHNDFDPIVSRALPDVARAHERLKAAGADATLLCGSGTAVAGFFRSVADAEVAVSHIDLTSGEWSSVAGFADGD